MSDVETDDDPLPASGYRTYEVYQRERVGESITAFTPRELIGDEMLTDPYRVLSLMRERTPCYRDWIGNQFWVTRYDDVTSVFTDDANYVTRPRRWWLDVTDLGRDLGDEIPVLRAEADGVDTALDLTVERILDELFVDGTADLATGFAARLPLELWGRVLDLPHEQLGTFSRLLWRIERGLSWEPSARADGRRAIDDLIALLDPLVDARRRTPGDDLISAALTVDMAGDRVGTNDIVTTLLERDHRTLHGGLSNLWFLLVTHPEQLALVRGEPRLVKFAWLEALRHSPPLQSALRFTRHEVERFGRLLPDGALVRCSAAAANRDPRVFADPDEFRVERDDLCQREPRGQYRADGLPAGVAFGFGPPSKHPAVPKERPRSRYALYRDAAVTASRLLLERAPGLRVADGPSPSMRSLRLDEMYTCWNLTVTRSDD